ncbi:hypothetical protein T265_14082, partial [Opisthorchis viverrini]
IHTFVLRVRWLGFADRKVRGSNSTSASRLPLSRLGQPDSIPALKSDKANQDHFEGVPGLVSTCAEANLEVFQAHLLLHVGARAVKSLSAATPFRCLAALPPEGSTRVCDTPRSPKSRQGKSRGEGRVRSVNSRSNHLSHLAPCMCKRHTGRKRGQINTWRLKHEAFCCCTFSCLETSQTVDSAGLQRLKHEVAWCSTFSCLKTSQTRDSARF